MNLLSNFNLLILKVNKINIANATRFNNVTYFETKQRFIGSCKELANKQEAE